MAQTTTTTPSTAVQLEDRIKAKETASRRFLEEMMPTSQLGQRWQNGLAQLINQTVTAEKYIPQMSIVT